MLEIYKNNNADKTKNQIKKILSPYPISNPEGIEALIPYRYLYTGPGKWIKIIKDYDNRKSVG